MIHMGLRIIFISEIGKALYHFCIARSVRFSYSWDLSSFLPPHKD